MSENMPADKAPTIHIFPDGLPEHSVRADQELAAVKDDSLKGRHALELRIKELETTVRHLATKEDLEKAKTRALWSAVGMAISLIAAVGSVIAAVAILAQ